MRKAREWLVILGITGFVVALVGGFIYFNSRSSPRRLAKGARASFAAADFDQSIAQLDEYLRHFPNEAGAYLARGMALARMHEYERAIQEFTKAIRLYPRGGISYYGRAWCYCEEGEFEKALADLDEAERLGVPPRNVLYTRGYANFELGNFDAAIADLDKAIELAPEFALAFHYRGCAHAGKDELDLAIRDLSEAIRLNPKAATSYCERGEVHFNKQEYEQARADFEEAIRLDAKVDLAYEWLAWTLATSPTAMLRDGKRAVELATTACKLTDWQNCFALQALAAGYAESGDFPSAINWQQKALVASDITDHERNVAKARLALYTNNKPYHYE